ncbi:hypothetical protein RRF57_005074 [Xylaria bambusicola]|uniref:Uncharacterized protein n=1 Tax=Xylaria bambusicola TaxID=326684 RepID=A0AAN7UXD0_9PEZI
MACSEANVRKAKAPKAPVARLPIDSNNVLWILLQPHVWKILDALPSNGPLTRDLCASFVATSISPKEQPFTKK